MKINKESNTQVGNFSINIILANEDDIIHILEIEQEANSPSWTHGALLSEIYKEDSFFIVAVDNENIIGFAIMNNTDNCGEILKIAVDKSWRRKGVGDLLIRSVLDHAECMKYDSVFLEVRKTNDAAIRLYEKHGFNKVRVRKDYYTHPIEDAFIMMLEFKEMRRN